MTKLIAMIALHLVPTHGAMEFVITAQIQQWIIDVQVYHNQIVYVPVQTAHILQLPHPQNLQFLQQHIQHLTIHRMIQLRIQQDILQ